MYKIYKNIIVGIALIMYACVYAQTTSEESLSLDNVSQYRHFMIKPSNTDSDIINWDTASQIYYDPDLGKNNLLLWLAGTKGTPEHSPEAFLKVALEQGYRIISLSYVTEPAVAQVCKKMVLEKMPDCASQFRRARIYGDKLFALIPDQPQDAITHRLKMLLAYLVRHDPYGNWEQYLKNGEIIWEKIAVAGQSQGGGMAEYLGKYEKLARVISFSGGWDRASPEHIAAWYDITPQTPLERWYGTYHVNELEAATLIKSYHALAIPSDHIYALDLPLNSSVALLTKKNPYHGQGIRNPAYQAIWRKMLGSGKEGADNTK